MVLSRVVLKVFIPVLCVAAVALNFFFHVRTVRESVSSAQVYWSGDRALVTLTTTSEVRDVGYVTAQWETIANRAGLSLKLPSADVRRGKAHVFTWNGKAWDHVVLPPDISPTGFELWPYAGQLYTWDRSRTVREWGGRILKPVPAQRADELLKSFPNDPANYLPAGPQGSQQPFAIMQDVITRDEWRAYQGITRHPNGTRLAFNIGDKTLNLVVTRVPNPDSPSPSASGGEVGLALTGDRVVVPIWQAQGQPRAVSQSELALYGGAGSAAPRRNFDLNLQGYMTRKIAIAFGVPLLLFLLSALTVKPKLLAAAPKTVQLAQAVEADYPRLDHDKWNDYTERLKALGFVKVQDVTLVRPRGKESNSIARVMMNPEARVYADVHQVFAAGAPKMACGFISYLGEDWTVSHGDQAAQPGSAVFRSGRILSFPRPGMQIEDLFREHLETRTRIAGDLGLEVEQLQGFSTYEQRTNHNAATRHQVIKETNICLLLLRYYRARYFGRRGDWLGDYAGTSTRAPGDMHTAAGRA